MTMKKDDLLFKLKQVQRDHYMTQAEIAREIGISDSTLSQVYNDSYKGNLESILAQIEGWLIPLVDPNAIDDIVHTSTHDELCDYFDRAYKQHTIYAVTGKSGFGKSVAARYYARVRLRAYWIPGRANMGAKHLLTEIARAANIQHGSANSVYEMQNKVMDHFRTRSSLLIIDEADKLNVKTLDAIREIYDLSSIGIILVGEESLYNRLQQVDRSGLSLVRLFSRIDEFYLINNISAENVLLYLRHYGFREFAKKKDFEYLCEQINHMGGYRRLAKVVQQLRTMARTSDADMRTISRETLVQVLSKFPS